MDSCQHACKRTVYMQSVVIEVSAPARDHREHVFLRMCLEILRQYSGVILAFHTFLRLAERSREDATRCFVRCSRISVTMASQH